MRYSGILLFLICTSWYHPIHVSVTNIDLDPGSGTITWSVKIFADDFQDLILNNYSVQLRITEQEDPQDQMETVNMYIGKALQLEINGKNVEGVQFIGTHLNENAIWLNYKYEHDGPIRKIRIKNTLMLETFDDQTNLVIISYNNKQNGYRMDSKKTDLTVDIK